MRVLVLAALAACSPMTYSPGAPGVPNLDTVDPGVYRSGQPTGDGWVTVERLADGRRVHVIKLNTHDEGSDEGAVARGFDLHYLPVQPEDDQGAIGDVAGLFERPDQTRLDDAVSLMCTCRTLPATDVCLVHCTHGQDRTGLVVGEYRVRCDGWSKDDAYREMLAHHFHWEIPGLLAAWEDFP